MDARDPGFLVAELLCSSSVADRRRRVRQRPAQNRLGSPGAGFVFTLPAIESLVCFGFGGWLGLNIVMLLTQTATALTGKNKEANPGLWGS